MKVSVILSKKKINKNGEAPVSIKITDKKKEVRLSSGISVHPELWAGGGIVKNDNKQTARIMGKLNAAEGVISRLELSGLIKGMTLKQIKEAILIELNGAPVIPKNNFITYFNKIADSKDAPRTREIYHATIKALERFDNNVSRRVFEDITPKYLAAFQKYMVRGSSLNGAALHLRNIRAVFNAALDDEITQYYPFRKFKIKHSATAKKHLGIARLREIWNCKVEPHQQKYLDFWKLSFLLIGINTKDLCESCTLRNGRLEYIRAKTRKPYSIKVEPEALVIIKKYQGKERLLSFSEGLKNYRMFATSLQRELKRLGGGQMQPVESVTKHKHKERITYITTFPELTMYHARHTWASLAAELDIPKETIAAALGHSQNSVTDIYIDFDMRKVDDANRRVIDYALYGKK